MQIAVSIDDLAFVAADAVARPVNAELRAVTPVIRRLEVAAGDGLLRQLQMQHPLEVGAAVVTGGGAVKADFMIHAVVSTETEAVSRDGVRRATASALQRAHDFAVEALAIAPFGLGAGNLDVEDAARMMLTALRLHAERRARPSEVTIVVENEWEADAFRAAISYTERPA
ncbi:MAG: macro domain-containing protein [Gemmatimonadota bacterium]